MDTITRTPDGTLTVAGIMERIETATDQSGLRRLIRTEEWVRRCGEEAGQAGEDVLVSEIQFRMYEIWNHLFDDTDDLGGGYTIGRWARAVGRNVLFEHERHYRCGGMRGAPSGFRLGHIDPTDGDIDDTALDIIGTGHEPTSSEHGPSFNAGSARIAQYIDPGEDAHAVYAKVADQTMRVLRSAFIVAGYRATWERLVPKGDIRLNAAVRNVLITAVQNLYRGQDPDIDHIQRVIERNHADNQRKNRNARRNRR